MTEYLPEGSLINSPKNKAAFESAESLREAQKNKTILEAVAKVCTAKHDLVLDLGIMRGINNNSSGFLRSAAPPASGGKETPLL